LKDLARIAPNPSFRCENRVFVAPRQILHGLKAIQDDGRQELRKYVDVDAAKTQLAAEVLR
jgi:hypothetical protein